MRLLKRLRAIASVRYEDLRRFASRSDTYIFVAFQRFEINVAFFGIALWILSFIFWRLSWGIFATPLWEAGVIAGFLLIFLNQGAIKSYITVLPRPFLRAYVIFFFVFCLGHCLGISRTTFPFVSWNMYSDETRFSPWVNFFRYDGTTQNGHKVVLRPEIYFRSLANGRLVTDLDNLVSSIIFYDPVKQKDLFKRRKELEEDYFCKHNSLKGMIAVFRLNTYEENLSTLDQKKQHLNEVLKAIARRFNAWHPADPLKSIDVMKGTISLMPDTNPKEIFSHVWHINL